MVSWVRGRTIYLVIGSFLLAYLFVSLTLHYRYNTTDADLAIYAQHVWFLSQGDFLGYGGTFKDFNIFGDHLILHFFWISLLYKVWESASVLIIIQTLAIILSALPLWWFAKERLKDSWSALLLITAYLLFYGYQAAQVFPFHGAALSTVFISFTLWFVYKKRWRWYFLFLILAFGAKEDVSTFGFVLGIYLFFFSSERKIGLATSILSAIYFYISLFMIIPFFTQGRPYAYFVEQQNSKFYNPLVLIKDFFYPWVKTRTLFTLFGSFGFLPLLAPTITFLALPFLLARFTNPTIQRWLPWMHYSANQGPILAFASVVGLENLNRFLEKLNKLRFLVRNPPYFYRVYLSLTLLLTIGIGLFYRMPLYQLLNPRFYQTPLSTETINQALKLIPADPNISVATQSGLLPHLSLRRKIYMYPHPSNAVNEPRGDLSDSDSITEYAAPDADYFILSKHAFHWRPSNATFDEVLDYVRIFKDYDIIFDQDSTVVLKRTP